MYLELPGKKDDDVFYHQTEEMPQMKWPLMNATNARHFTTTFGLILQLLITQMTCPSFQEMTIKQNSVPATCPVLHRATTRNFITRPSVYIHGLSACSICRNSNSGIGSFSDSFACPWVPFLPAGLPCPASMWGFVLSLITSCYTVFGWYHWEAWSLLMGKIEKHWIWGRRRESGKQELGEVKGEDAVVRMHCMREVKKFKKIF